MQPSLHTLRQLGLVPFFAQQMLQLGVPEEQLARVMSVQRSQLVVWGQSGKHAVELSLALQQAAAVDRPTVGDWVVLDESRMRVEQVLERKSLFKRLGVGKGAEIQPIAANIDTLFIVTSCNEEFKESRLERYLALCLEAGATPVIVLTKADLTDDAEAFVERVRRVRAGVAVETVNALDPGGLDGLRAWIGANSTVALAGSSGVGKSTLVNSLASDDVAATGDIREQDKHGRHTTTHRELHVLPTGGLLIDVPGMRELRVADVEEALGEVFDDIEQLAAQCQFHDCQHQAEPGCAVKRAIEDGRIEARRLNNYQKLKRENALSTESLAERHARERGFGRMVKSVKRLKQQKQER